MNNEMGMTDDEVILRVRALERLCVCNGCVADAILMGIDRMTVTIPDAALRSMVANDGLDGQHKKGIGFLICSEGIRVVRNMSDADREMGKKTAFIDHGAYRPSIIADRYVLALARRKMAGGGSP